MISAAYVPFMVNAVASGWLASRDYVVVDNAILHSSGSADVLTDCYGMRLDLMGNL